MNKERCRVQVLTQVYSVNWVNSHIGICAVRVPCFNVRANQGRAEALKRQALWRVFYHMVVADPALLLGPPAATEALTELSDTG